MVTVAGALELMPSFATRRNVKAVSAVTSGGVNVGVALVAESSTTAGPSVWVHVKRSVSPSASVEPDASSVTLPERSSTVVGPPSFTPATATGRLFTFVTMTCTTLGRLESVPSLTTSWNVKMVFVETDALKLGVAVVAPLSVTAGPPTCVHAYVRAAPSGSRLPVPLSVMTVGVRTPPAPTMTSATVWDRPASATGATLQAGAVPVPVYVSATREVNGVVLVMPVTRTSSTSQPYAPTPPSEAWRNRTRT